MKRIILLSLFLLAFTLSACNFAYGQFSRVNRIYRPCSGSTTPASVAISSAGAITLTPCSGQAITQTTTGTVTLASPTFNIGTNTLSKLDMNNLIANTIILGALSSASNGQITVGGSNSWSFPTTSFLQLGATGGGAVARLDLNRSTSTTSLLTTTFDWSDSSLGVTTWKLRRTVTAGGTTGNQTINLLNGTVNFAAAATTITVTNSTVSATSQIIVTPQRLDATCRTFVVDSKAAGTFNIVATSACTAETSVAFWVTN